jgi:uncharacterized cupin superfamily protein
MAAIAFSEARPFLPGYATRSCRASGDVASRGFCPEGGSLWLVHGRLGAGAALEWDTEHGDEAVYVVSGELAAGDSRCGPGDVFIVESTATAMVRAGTDVEVLHFGPVAVDAAADGVFGPPEDLGRGTHVVPSGGLYLRRTEGLPLTSVVYADSACRTCRINLFLVSGPDGYRTGSHLHSQDEIVHVLAGELQVGRNRVGAGESVAVPANQRYGFQARGAFSFLNYRRDVSTAVAVPGTEPVLEARRPPGEPVPVTPAGSG